MDEKKRMLIGIIAALPAEVEPLIKCFNISNTVTVAGTKFYKAHLMGQELVFAASGIGKVNAACCTQTLILSFTADMVIDFGCAGSLDENIANGDFVVATEAKYFEMDLHFVSQREIRFCSSKPVVDLFISILQKMQIPYHVGTIVTCDHFVADVAEKMVLRKTFSALAVDMESAAIGQVCMRNNVPFASVRIISDSLTKIESAGSYLEIETASMMSRSPVFADLLKAMMTIVADSSGSMR